MSKYNWYIECSKGEYEAVLDWIIKTSVVPTDKVEKLREEIRNGLFYKVRQAIIAVGEDLIEVVGKEAVIGVKRYMVKYKDDVRVDSVQEVAYAVGDKVIFTACSKSIEDSVLTVNYCTEDEVMARSYDGTLYIAKAQDVILSTPTVDVNVDYVCIQGVTDKLTEGKVYEVYSDTHGFHTDDSKRANLVNYGSHLVRLLPPTGATRSSKVIMEDSLRNAVLSCGGAEDLADKLLKGSVEDLIGALAPNKVSFEYNVTS